MIVKKRNFYNTCTFINDVRNLVPVITNYHTDNFNNYINYFKMTNLNHTTTKDETTQVESFNSIMRGFIAPLVRRTKCVIHSLEKLYDRLFTFFFFYNKKIRSFLDFKNYCTTFVSVFS